MYCTLCGTIHTGNHNFCLHCGSSLLAPGLPEQVGLAIVRRPTPFGMILLSWLLLFMSFFPFGLLNVPLYFLVLMCAVLLLTSKDKSAMLNGRIILLLCLVSIVVGIITGKMQQYIGPH